MAHFIQVSIKVADFSTWKTQFDGHEKMRNDAGLKIEHIFRAESDANDVSVIFRTSDPAKTKAFMESDDLKERMKESGVVSKPDIRMFHD